MWYSGRRRAVALLLVPLLAAVPAGCRSTGSRHAAAPSGASGWAVATPSASAAAGFDLAAAMDVIRHKGFTPDEPPGPLAGPLRAIKAICTGSADGACAQVFFFDGQRLVDGVQAATVTIVGQDGTTVTLRFPQFGPDDPLCCPSEQPRVHTVRLGGGGIVAEPPIPSNPNRQSEQ